ncbi:MAG: hypothetical protein R3F61_33065 [Myxococcota bacterium]
MKNFLLPLLSLALVAGCHSRFKRVAPTVGVVRVEANTLGGPDVDLGRAYVSGGGGLGDVLSSAYNITQMVREGNIAAHIAEKVRPDQVNAAFVHGFRESLGDGPPFGSTTEPGALLEFQLVDWGMELYGWGRPGVYNYEVVVRGYDANGKKMYRTSYQCYTDAGTTGWIEKSPFAGSSSPDSIKNIPAEQIQAIFDATAYDCGRQFVSILRKHAG